MDVAKAPVLRWSVTPRDVENLMEISAVPRTALSGRRRAVDASDLRQCALVQTMMKTSAAFASHR